MKIMGRYIPQRVEFLSLLVALGLVLFIALLSYRAWDVFDRRSEQFDITQQIVDGTNALLSSITDAETAQRGFLLTGEDRYLQAHQQALARILATFSAFRNTIASRRPDQALRVYAIEPLIRSELDELQQTIKLRQVSGLDAALAVLQTDRGIAASDQIRQSCAEIQAVAYSRLKQYSEESRSSANQLGFVGTFGSIGLFVLLLLSSFTIQRGIHRREGLIRDLQETEAKTTEVRDLLQTTIGSIGEAVIATDANGKVTFLNAVARSLTGWAEATGLPLEQIFVINNEETGAAVENPVNKVLREGRIVGLANQTRLTSKDQRQIPIDHCAAPLRDATGKVIGVVVVFRDVTAARQAARAEKTAAAELARHAESLERTNAELQHFAYAASHDLREPLRTITAYTQLVQLRSGSQLDKQSAECLEFIVAAADRMGLLIEALMDYSKAGEVIDKPLHAVHMDKILARALGNLNGSVEKNKAVVTHGPLPAIMGDETHIEQLIQNLIGNALKYRRQDPPRVHIAARELEEEWLFSISDNGQGVAPQYQTQIFELFKRLHGHKHPGTGIGLATCKKIVERYGGRIWVESEVGKGSTFFFTLPAKAPFQQSASA
jgi:PAS domain S-box-containing protein